MKAIDEPATKFVSRLSPSEYPTCCVDLIRNVCSLEKVRFVARIGSPAAAVNCRLAGVNRKLLADLPALLTLSRPGHFGDVSVWNADVVLLARQSGSRPMFSGGWTCVGHSTITMASSVGPQKPYYIRHNLYITTSGVCDFSPLLCALLALSSDNILFAADYPFEDLNTATAFLRSAPISEDDRAKIAHGNTQRLLHLQARVARRAFDELTDAGHLLRCMSPEVAPLRHAD